MSGCGFRSFLLLFALPGLALACHRRTEGAPPPSKSLAVTTGTGASSSLTPLPSFTAGPERSTGAATASRTASSATLPPPPHLSSSAPPTAAAAPLLVAGPPVDLGPAAPFRLLSDELRVLETDKELSVLRLRRQGLALTASSKRTDGTSTPHAPLVGALAVTGGATYWVAARKAWRSDTSGKVSAVATPAPAGNAVSAWTPPGAAEDWVLTLRDLGDERTIWLSRPRGEGMAVVPSPAGVSSFITVPVGRRLLLAALDGRLGWSSLHVRWLSARTDGTPELGADQILSVLGTAHPTTTLAGWVDGDQRLLTVAMESDASHFGLGLLRWTGEEAKEVRPQWLPYANGLAPAPHALATVCGLPTVAFASPAEATPGARQTLAVGYVAGQEVVAPLPLQAARRWLELQIVGSDSGGVVVANDGSRLQGFALRCQQRP